jgi:hypothetical protein
MSDCATPAHLRKLGESAVADSDRRIASIPPDLCGSFTIEAIRLEDDLIRIYKQVVLCVRDEPDLQKVASWWEFMVGMCDFFAERLSHLKTTHPACGADLYYDRILDLRNKCHRLQEMHA